MKFSLDDKLIKRTPDIVVCNSRSIIGVVELKYLPRAEPNFEGDLKKLAAISMARSEISISNIRYQGEEKDGRKYRVANKTLFVWAGVHKALQQPPHLFSEGEQALQKCYMQLHAATHPNAPPDIFEIY